MITANSYLISSPNLGINSNTIENKEPIKNFFDFGINLLIGFLTIKQIGAVSAQTTYCCEKLQDSGAWCQEVTDIGQCDSAYSSILTSCDSTSYCEIGTCIPADGGFCSAGSPRGLCESNGDMWDESPINEIAQCRTGCCISGIDTDYLTESACNNLIDQNGFGSFYTSISETSCKFFTEEEGACIYDGICTRIAEEQCIIQRSGQFHPGHLCSNPDLGTSCEPKERTGCVNGKDEIYWFDSCGNVENIYGTTGEDSTKYIINKDSSCGAGNSNINSQTCGNCDYYLGSVCSETDAGDISINDGDFVCKDLNCPGAGPNGEQRFNTESWCVYDGRVGNSLDTVGSEHFRVGCFEGEVISEACSSDAEIGRDFICAQKTTDSGRLAAQCRPNLGFECTSIEIEPYRWDGDGDDITDYNEQGEDEEECNALTDCRVQTVNVDAYFKFKSCVPKYPYGTTKICGVGSQTCTAIYLKEISTPHLSSPRFLEEGEEWSTLDGGPFGKNKFLELFIHKKIDEAVTSWVCEANCQCENAVFLENINDFCIALGDCGGYYNFNEVYEDDYDVNVGISPDTETSNRHSITSDGYNLDARYRGGGFLNPALSDYPLYIGNPLDEGSYSDPDAVIGDPVDPDQLADSVAFTQGVAAVILFIAYTQSWNIVGWIAAAVLVVLEVLGIGDTEPRNIDFTCEPWTAPPGGADCEVCNGDSTRPCDTYRCESLGQSCRLIDESTDNPLCIYSRSEDVIPPGITHESIGEGLKWVEDSAIVYRIKIERDDGSCIQEASEISFSLRTTENRDSDVDDFAQCQYSFTQTPPDYDNMNGEYFEEGSVYGVVNHTFINQLPRLFSDYVFDVAGLLGRRTGQLNIYVRCQDVNTNFNNDEYIVNLCIQEGPDNTVAEIKEFIPEDGSFLKHNETGQLLTIKLNEPAECSWSHNNVDYDSMTPFTSCDEYDPNEIKSRWDCSTELTGLTEDENKIYIRCKDQPWLSTPAIAAALGLTEEDRNVNVDAFEYTLYSTQNELKIDSISIKTENVLGTVVHELIPDVLKEIAGGGVPIYLDLIITTSGGAYDGNARCKYAPVKSPISFTGDFFFETNSILHKQEGLNLPNGEYNLALTCEDNADNEVERNAIFNLKIDVSPPSIVRAYKEGNNLKLISDEEASCVYSNDRVKACRFNMDSATIISSIYATKHSVDWDKGKTYFVKCKDLFGNDNGNSRCAQNGIIYPT